MVSIPMLRAGIHMSNLKVFDAATVFQFPCYAREFTTSADRVTCPKCGFNSHATRGNSPLSLAEVRAVWAVSIPMLRAGIHQPTTTPSTLTYPFQFPYYVREFTYDDGSKFGINNGFNSHATRGNSHHNLQTKWGYIHVSIPMLRAGIHRKIFRFVR